MSGAGVLLALMSCQKSTEEREADPCETSPLEAQLHGDSGSEGLTVTRAGCGEVHLTPVILGEGELSLELAWEDGVLTPTLTAGPEGAVFEGLSLSGEPELSTPPERWWRQGFQSWSWSGVLDVEEQLGEISFDDRGLPHTGGDGGGLSVTEEEPWSSWWVGLLGSPGGAASLLMGALSVRETKWWSATDGTQLWGVWGARGERLTLEGGERLTLDASWIDIGCDPFEMHQRYGEIASVHSAPDKELPETPPVGWSTWYQYYAEIDESLMLEELGRAEAWIQDPARQALDWFQIDDGWQQSWGDWEADLELFPSGMPAMAAAIEEAGLRPGLWLAPFLVDRESRLFSEHSDWWVRDAEGELLGETDFVGRDMVFLDPSHPDAAAWLDSLIRGHVADGWGYLKLDFLYAAMLEGQRHQDLSGAQAWHLGMEIIREAAGDALILACGSPMLPSLPYSDSFRTGADIAFDTNPDPSLDTLRWQTRSTAARSWTNGLWWWSDADPLLLREPFDDSQAGAAIAATLTSGGAWFLGDSLALDDYADLTLSPELLELLGQGATRPSDPLAWPSGFDGGPIYELVIPDDQVPSSWALPGGARVLLNLSGDSMELSSPGGRELLTGEESGAGTRSLPPGSAEIWLP